MRKKRKVGLLVEGEVAAQVLTALAKRICPRIHFHAVTLGGKAGLPWAYTSVIVLLEKDYDPILIVFNADTTDPANIANQCDYVEKTLRRYQLQDHAPICPAVRQLENWLIADSVPHPEAVVDAKSELERLFGASGPQQLRTRARQLDLDLAARRSASFRAFREALSAVASPSRVAV